MQSSAVGAGKLVTFVLQVANKMKQKKLYTEDCLFVLVFFILFDSENKLSNVFTFRRGAIKTIRTYLCVNLILIVASTKPYS